MLRLRGGGSRAQLVHAADLLPIPFSTEALGVLCANVGRVQDRLQAPYSWWKTSRPTCTGIPLTASALWIETEFLTTLARRTGCQLLVDVNNIYVNALNAQLRDGVALDPVQSCRDWIDAIPADVVGEIHLAGHCHVSDAHGDIVIDDHGSRVCDAVWDLYRHAIGRFGNVPTLIEWDTDVPSLDVLLDEAWRARTHCTDVLQLLTRPTSQEGRS
jgi:uncharacterized protein (UPF0276 family)